MSILISLAILMFPWIIAPLTGVHDPFRVPKELFFDMTCMSILVLGLWQGMKFRYWNKYLAVFSGWVFITILLNWSLPIAVATDKGCLWNLWTIQPSIHFILGLTALYIMLSNLEKSGYQMIAKAICWSAVAVCLFGILQLCGLDPFGKLIRGFDPHLPYTAKQYQSEKGYLLGTNVFYAMLDNPNLMGNYFALSLPFFLPFLRRNKYKLGFLICFIGLFLSRSYVAIASGLIGLLVFGLIKLINLGNRKFLAIYLAISAFFISLCGYFFVQRLRVDGLGYRLPCWYEGVMHLKSNPLFGQGLGIFKTFMIMPKVSLQTVWSTAHNDWLEMAIAIGILGVFLFALLLIHSFRNFNYRKASLIELSFFCSFIAFLFLMGGSFPLELPVLAFIGLVSYCVIEKS